MLLGKRLVWIVVAAAMVSGCSKDEKKGPAVARGDGLVVTAEEFKAKLDEQSPFIRARYATLDHKKEFLENLIRFQLLVHEAREQKLDRDPEVQATLEKIMVQKLVRKAFDEKEGAQASEGDVRKYFDQHKDEFVKPERVRLSQIFMRAEKGSTDRSRRAADAKKLYAKLKSDEPRNPLAFANQARDVSDDLASKTAGGDLGYRTQEELEKQWGKEVAQSALALKEIGQESGVVESAHGFHILKLAGRQPPLNRSFEEVKEQLIARLGRERRTRDFDEHVKKLRERAHVAIDDRELEKITVSAAAPAAPSPGPVPGGNGALPPRPAAVPASPTVPPAKK